MPTTSDAGWRTILQDIAIRRILGDADDWQADDDLGPTDEHRFYEVHSPHWMTQCLFIAVAQGIEDKWPRLEMQVRQRNWGEPSDNLGDGLIYVGAPMLAEELVRVAVERYRKTGLL